MPISSKTRGTHATAPVRVTPAAARLLVEGLEEHADPEDAVRVSVIGGGRSGLQYGLDFDPEVRRDDLVIDLPGGRKIVIDPGSAGLMTGPTIDAKSVVGDPEDRLGLWFRLEGG